MVEDDVAFGPENMQLPHEEIHARVDSALRQVGLSVGTFAESCTEASRKRIPRGAPTLRCSAFSTRLLYCTFVVKYGHAAGSLQGLPIPLSTGNTEYDALGGGSSSA